MKKKKPFSGVLKLLLFFVLFGALTAGIDYFRMNSGEVPIFNLKKYNEKTRIETYRGIFYKAERKVTASPQESLTDSSNMKFSILIFNLNVPRQFKEIILPYKIKTTEQETCSEPAKLYYADKDIKVYTYCLDSISVVQDNKEKPLINYLKKNNDFINDLDSKLSYTGLYKDKTTLVLKDKDLLTNNGLTIYHCNNSVKDFYLTKEGTDFQTDFCTPKDDDFEFMYQIVDESTPPPEPKPIKDSKTENQKSKGKNEKEEPNKTKEDEEDKILPLTILKEPFFEDEEYIYLFPYPKSDKVFLVTEPLRGFQAKKIPVKIALQNKMTTITSLEKKGLKFEKASKKEQIEPVKNPVNNQQNQ